MKDKKKKKKINKTLDDKMLKMIDAQMNITNEPSVRLDLILKKTEMINEMKRNNIKRGKKK